MIGVLVIIILYTHCVLVSLFRCRMLKYESYIVLEREVVVGA
jgi:hypothetical protein